jgi:transcriptional regulator with XRE-family HTH domain
VGLADNYTVVDSVTLRKLRQERGMSLSELASRAKVGVSTLARLERGTRPKGRNYTVARLAIALGMPFDSLRDRSDPRYGSNGSGWRLEARS